MLSAVFATMLLNKSTGIARGVGVGVGGGGEEAARGAQWRQKVAPELLLSVVVVVAATTMEARARAPSTSSASAKIAVSGVSVACATTCTNPLDVAKVRIQTASSSAPLRGIVGTLTHAVRTEGVGVLFSGLTPSLVRAFLYGGLRLGAFEPVREALRSVGAGVGAAAADDTPPTFGVNVLAGCISGGGAALLLNPTELLKTRMMLAGKAGASRASAAETLFAAARTDGIASLWRGCGLAMTRSAALTASQCATYGEVKKRWLALGITGDGLPAHLASSMLSGVATTLATNPVDMIKTQMYVSKGKSTQITAIMTLRRVLAEHGASGLLRGFWANYARLGPQTVVTFVVVEQLRAQLGMNSL